MMKVDGVTYRVARQATRKEGAHPRTTNLEPSTHMPYQAYRKTSAFLTLSPACVRTDMPALTSSKSCSLETPVTWERSFTLHTTCLPSDLGQNQFSAVRYPHVNV